MDEIINNFDIKLENWWDEHCDRIMQIVVTPKNPFPQGITIGLSVSEDLKNYLNNTDKSLTFNSYLKKFISESPLSVKELAEKAHVNYEDLRNYLYKKKRVTPYKKDVIFRIAIVLKLSFNDTAYLLSLAEVAFKPNDTFDRAITYFLTHEIYDLDAIDNLAEQINIGTIFRDQY
ncbi:MAG: hypothetical protein SPE00_05825 [Bacilli bacterium]|nr:hypothetical protein [Bacilli bacterium]